MTDAATEHKEKFVNFPTSSFFASVISSFPAEWQGVFGVLNSETFPLYTATNWLHERLADQTTTSIPPHWTNLVNHLSSEFPSLNVDEVSFKPKLLLLPLNLQKNVLTLIICHFKEIQLEIVEKLVRVLDTFSPELSDWTCILYKQLKARVITQLLNNKKGLTSGRHRCQPAVYPSTESPMIPNSHEQSIVYGDTVSAESRDKFDEICKKLSVANPPVSYPGFNKVQWLSLENEFVHRSWKSKQKSVEANSGDEANDIVEKDSCVNALKPEALALDKEVVPMNDSNKFVTRDTHTELICVDEDDDGGGDDNGSDGDGGGDDNGSDGDGGGDDNGSDDDGGGDDNGSDGDGGGDDNGSDGDGADEHSRPKRPKVMSEPETDVFNGISLPLPPDAISDRDIEADVSAELSAMSKSLMDRVSPLMALLQSTDSGTDSTISKQLRLQLGLLCECSSTEMEIACKCLNLSSVTEQTAVLLCQQFVDMETEPSYGNTVVFAHYTILPKLEGLEQPAARVLFATIMAFGKKFPRAFCDGVAVKLLTGNKLGTFQTDIICKVIKDAFGLEAVKHILNEILKPDRNLPNGSWSENIVTIVQAIVDTNVDIGSISFARFSQVLELNSLPLAKSLKFAKLILAVINKYGHHVVEHSKVFENILDSNATFLKKAGRMALKKLIK